MDMKNVNYIRIDEAGNMLDNGIITAENMFYIMDGSWDFTEEEVRARGYAPVRDSIRFYINGDTSVDIMLGEIVKNEDGSFIQTWIEDTISNEEKRSRFLERSRISLLLTSDWTQLPDSPLSNEAKAEWAVYRQLLRDLPATVNWSTINSSADINWPTIPGVSLPEPTDE